MITGTADPSELGRGRPTIAGLPADSLALRDVEMLQAFYEMPQRAREALLPPGLHPTNPAALVIQVWQCADSPWGAFSLAQARIQCRSGMRPRGFVSRAVCRGSSAASALREHLGYPIVLGDVELVRSYDRVDARVAVDGKPILDLSGCDPDPLAPSDLQYSSTLTLAHLPQGLRLVQIEPIYALERAERVIPDLRDFDAASWGDRRLDPYHPVSASIARGQIELPPVRFVCRPDQLAFTGTERVER